MQPDQRTFAVMADLFGDDWQEPENYISSAKGPQTEEQVEVERVAEFEQMVAEADIAAIENDSTAMGPKARLHRGQFYHHAVRIFSKDAADLAYEAWFVDASCARINSPMWQSLRQLQAVSAPLYNIIIGLTAWQQSGRAGVDHGPFGNDWGE